MRSLLIAAAAVAVLALGALAIGGAATSAQEGDGPIGTFLGKVADKLGVGEDQLKDAVKDAQLEMIDEAVVDGRLTEEQAERLRERAEEGGLMFPPPDGRHKPRPGVCQRAVLFVQEAAAEVLEVPVGQVEEELKQGKSLAEIAEDQEMGVEEFTEAMLAQVQVQLDELVSDGKLTEEQAERIFQKTEEHIDRIVNAEPRPQGPCPPRHGPGDAPDGIGGPRHGSFGDKPETAVPSDVTA